jgi:hypothetical protein
MVEIMPDWQEGLAFFIAKARKSENAKFAAAEQAGGIGKSGMGQKNGSQKNDDYVAGENSGGAARGGLHHGGAEDTERIKAAEGLTTAGRRSIL